ncbi:hypothetical protein ANOM_011217 [Aspergillus nomiae NRRL 13137]|uniref:ELYS-like domain-containing protein n=1 Tax=Aspergillus nomiae NRRL (strain ATCC 15546 / NRRL 13137 / CBS 260.88 / M93) TaxID=1509407 RepID=A0A0L1IND3_ASPN3|nr:uncharacterized protein ANOM_011217 [Aspergillus nomiae NRRL 13137]KNG80835.1 hypothetical protein ANOM_011217 [Aspergillus nomiae NRRL 13137]
MAPWEDFDSVFSFNKNFVYDGKVIEQILSNRRALENQLFADRLLGLLGVKAGNIDQTLMMMYKVPDQHNYIVTKVYPPKSNADLRTLFGHIVSSPLDIHHKQALIYYLLKDCRAANDYASQFSRRFHLPEKYRLFIEGLWNLDRLEFRRAIEYLTEPSIIPTFPDEILYVLTLPQLPKHDNSLVMAYYLTVSPPLASTKVQKAFFRTLCRSSITEAFYFTRNYDDSLRQNYLAQLIEFVHSTEAGETRSKRAMELIGLPFDDQEEGWFEDSLLRGNAKGLHGAKDTVMMRRLATGKLENLSADLESLGGKKVDGLNWDILRQERCKFEHPGQSSLGSGNRFGVLSGGGGGGGGGFGGRSAQQNQQPANYGVTADDIKIDLTAGKGRPEWVFSCYGPGKNAPKQLFGGVQREQSFEELRLRHYEAAAAGNAEQAVQEAQALYAEALKQMDVILSDLGGAVKYIVDGINEHPNRIDITEGKTGPASSQGPSPFGQPSAFGQPAASSQTSGFGQPSAMGQSSGFGQPSTLGSGSAFGKPSGFGQPSALGQPSGFGQPSALGQSSGFGQPSALASGSAFGKPSGLGGGQPAFGKPAFGQPSLGQPNQGQPAFGQSSAFGQPSSLGGSSFGASTNASPFGAISNQNQNAGVGFGQAASATSPFAQAASQQPAAASGFGQPSTTPATSGGFSQPAQTPSPFGQPQPQPQPQPSSNPFGQPSTAPNPFGAPSQPQQQQAQAAPSPFGQPAAGFAQPAQQQPPAPTATACTGPPGIIKVEDPNQLSPIPPLSGQTIRDPMTKRLSTWKGQPVKYIDNNPCYLHPQDRQTYVRIFFPDGPPDQASLRDATGKPEEYTPEVTEQYEFFVKNGYFKDGVIPSVPPKTEWVSFDF